MLFANICLTQCTKTAKELNVMSFNIRMDTEEDKDNKWLYRKDFAANLIKFYDVDIFGAQEVLHHQLVDMLERLPDYNYVGVGREDGAKQGEYSPIFFNKTRFAVDTSGTFWLAEDMNAVGKEGWDAACSRVATWGVFTEKSSGKKFFFINTHLDHVGQVARRKGVELILKQIEEKSKGLVCILTGDFNATPNEEPIQYLLNSPAPQKLLDTRSLAKLHYGTEWTFHDYGRIPVEQRPCIDYIFIRGDVTVQRYAVLTETLNHIYPSDHCPVLSTILIRN
ncbi:MAG: endonuclease/exonuclease/phosphatase family protein [Bacteroidales bacterium]